MSKLRGALKQRKEADDEYYTTFEEVENIFVNFIPKDEIKDKIIYCPCDSEASNFIIYLKDHKADLQYKELIYTWDDFNTHIELFEKCDIIITNPPFSKLIREFIPILNKVNKKFFIFGSTQNLHNYFNYFKLFNNVHYQKLYPQYPFMRPDGSLAYVHHLYIYNLDNIEIKDIKSRIFTDPKEPAKAYDENGKLYYEFKFLSNIPRDFKEEFLCPLTILYDRHSQYVEYIKPIPPNLKFEDGKPRFVRYLTKLKNI